jgi:beta-glucosidase
MSADDPLRNLRALGRVTIALGQTKRVALTFPAASLRRWDTDQHDYVIDPGDYKLEVGAASDDPRLTTTFRISE